MKERREEGKKEKRIYSINNIFETLAKEGNERVHNFAKI